MDVAAVFKLESPRNLETDPRDSFNLMLSGNHFVHHERAVSLRLALGFLRVFVAAFAEADSVNVSLRCHGMFLNVFSRRVVDFVIPSRACVSAQALGDRLLPICRNTSVCCPSVCLSFCLSVCLSDRHLYLSLYVSLSLCPDLCLHLYFCSCVLLSHLYLCTSVSP